MARKEEVTAMTWMKFSRKTATALAIVAGAALPLAFTSLPASAQQADAKCVGRDKHNMWINVVAEGIRNDRGKLVVTIYPDKSSKFLASDGEINVGKVDAKTGETRARVCIPKAGVYGIAVYHDEDSDGKFDRNLLPTEGFGFSNNPSTLAGLPMFRSVRLSVPKSNLTTRIKIKYP